jgi:hypothetical protein
MIITRTPLRISLISGFLFDRSGSRVVLNVTRDIWS